MSVQVAIYAYQCTDIGEITSEYERLRASNAQARRQADAIFTSRISVDEQITNIDNEIAQRREEFEVQLNNLVGDVLIHDDINIDV